MARAAPPAAGACAHAAGASFGEGCEPLELSNVTLRAMVNGDAWAVIEVASVHGDGDSVTESPGVLATPTQPAMTIVLQKSAWAFFGRADIERLTSNFHPAAYDVVVVKRGNVESLAVPMLVLAGCMRVLRGTYSRLERLAQ